jgi:hypothetical protein
MKQMASMSDDEMKKMFPQLPPDLLWRRKEQNIHT